MSQYRPPQPRHPTPGRVPGRGVPDRVLLGGLALLIIGTTVIWLSTGLAALLTGNAWPERVRYRGSALAGHSLFTDPDDLAAAWPHTPAGQLPSPTAFWVAFGLLITLLLIGVLLMLRTWLRWRNARDSKAPKRNQALPEGE